MADTKPTKPSNGDAGSSDTGLSAPVPSRTARLRDTTLRVRDVVTDTVTRPFRKPDLEVPRLHRAMESWGNLTDEKVEIMTTVIATPPHVDDETRGEFVALIRTLRELDSKHRSDAVIRGVEIERVLKDHGVRLGAYQLVKLLSTAQRQGAGGEVDVVDLWSLYSTLPPRARLNQRIFRETWEGSLLLHEQISTKHGAKQRSAWKDFIAGSAAGVAATVVGHPFDTIKVRMQTGGPQYVGVVDCVRRTFAREGLAGFYKGMASPLVTVPLVNAVVFASYGQAKWLLERRIRKEAEADHNPVLRPLTVSETMVAGAFAGLVNSVVVGPVELVKCRLQAATTSNVGSWNCAKDIYQQAGVKGLCRGMIATVAREVPSYIGQFGTYEWLKIKLTPEGEETKDLSPARTVVAGGCAGTVCWVISYPMDVLKSMIQLQPYGVPRQFPNHRFIPDGGMIACSRHIVKTEGFMGFWRGVLPCVLRAFPANGAGFLAYEASWRVLDML